jgi:soluble lytic murein transglycosylase-like protein
MKQLVLTAIALVWASGARAEIVLLENGMTFKAASRRLEGDTVFLELKGGGEVGIPLATIVGAVPDEVLDEIAAGGDVHALAAEAARRHGLDPALVLAVVAVESSFRADAVSPKGAQGLMQLMPPTAASLGVADPFDAASNLDGGTRHLGALLARYDGDLKKALAAYNAGERAVQQYRGVPPYRETRAYVSKVLKRYRKAK